MADQGITETSVLTILKTPLSNENLSNSLPFRLPDQLQVYRTAENRPKKRKNMVRSMR
jgi:hypothetical protein